GHRYAHAQDLAVAFRLALETSSTELDQARKDVLLPSDVTSSGIYPSNSLFDSEWRAEFSPIKESQPPLDQSTPLLTGNVSNMPTGVFVSIKNLPQPVKSEPEAEKSPHPLHIVHFNPITPPQETRRYPEQITLPGNVISAMPVQ